MTPERLVEIRAFMDANCTLSDERGWHSGSYMLLLAEIDALTRRVRELEAQVAARS